MSATAATPDVTVRSIGALLRAHGACLALAESCTGGLIAGCITDVAGSSDWFERALVTYSNRAKQELLGVSPAVLNRCGAVSRECALAMAEGLMQHTPADWGLAVTGIAGPGGGSADKPVGTVWIAWVRRGAAAQAQHYRFAGDRAAVRAQSVDAALAGLLERLQHGG